MRTWRAGLKPGFFSWLVPVVVCVLNDGLPTVHLLDTLGSYGVCVSAAAMLIAAVFSYLRRDLVGPALFGVASPCWQQCFSCVSALVGFSCISFPGRIKGESEGKKDWKAPLSFGTFIDIPDQVTSNAGSGTLVAAAALDKSHAKRRASLAAAAFVFFFCGAAAASCCVSITAAAGSINASEGLFAFGGMPDVYGDCFLQVLLGRPLALAELYFVLIWIN